MPSPLFHPQSFYTGTVIRFFSLQKYFRTQKTYENILHEYNFTTKIFPTTAHQRPHTSTSLVAAASISLYSWQPLTQQAIYFSPAISLARAAISSINAHHTQLVKLFSFNFVCPKIILREYFFLRKFTRQNKSELRYYQAIVMEFGVQLNEIS